MMINNNWITAVAAMKKSVVKIDTPTCSGTGFAIPPPSGKEGFGCIMTAWHVIEHSAIWKEPICFVHPLTNTSTVFQANEIEINPAQIRDQVYILFDLARFFYTQPVQFAVNSNFHFIEGVEIGWLGYPNLYPQKPCFFHGYVSSYDEDIEAYIVDGVAIHGVSGGPVFEISSGTPVVVGLVTNYRPNQTLPGISIVRSVNPLLKHYESEMAKQAQQSWLQYASSWPQWAPNQKMPINAAVGVQ